MSDVQREDAAHGTCGQWAALDLSKPLHLRAEMARAALGPIQMRPYEDPERGWVDPLAEDETRTTIRRFLAALWQACERAEADDA